MRYLRRYESHEDIDVICQKWGIANYTVNADGSIDVNDGIDLHDRGLTKLPLNFRNVEGYFACTSNKLTSLEGCPVLVGGYFSCVDNRLTSLKGCPKSVGEGFYCSHNRLTSLEGCPKWVGGGFYCNNNDIVTGNQWYLQSIDTFEGLDFIHIRGYFYCSGNPIYKVWKLFNDHTKFEFFNDCDIIREDRVIILDRLNFFLDYIGKDTVTEVEGYKCI